MNQKQGTSNCQKQN